MRKTQLAIYKIEYPFGTLIVDKDIYYRIVEDKSKRPWHKYKRISSLQFRHGLLRCSFRGRNRTYTLSRLLIQPAGGLVVDHINRNPLDNRRCNLRAVSLRQNSLNRLTKNRTGLVGVSVNDHYGKKQLCAQFKKSNGKNLFFYMYDTPANRIICALVHDKFVIQSGDDEYAPLNYPHLRKEPFRTRLLKTEISEFRKNKPAFFARRFGLKISV